MLVTQRFHHFDGLRVAVWDSKGKVNIAILLKLILKQQAPVSLVIVAPAKPANRCDESHLPFHLLLTVRVRDNVDLALKAHKSGQVDDDKAALLAAGCPGIEVEPKVEAMRVDVVLQEEIKSV